MRDIIVVQPHRVRDDQRIITFGARPRHHPVVNRIFLGDISSIIETFSVKLAMCDIIDLTPHITTVPMSSMLSMRESID